ncbi:MAG TPA: 4a-hydroxytetrahydrobiopterin dehydratase [Anaerolineales bacterium]|nr:4a-hydroxytetrahydrobiopterin dehydratase [Anaerolineales bacterium]
MFVIPRYQPFHKRTEYQNLGIPGYLYRPTAYQNFGNAGYLYVNWWTHVIKGLHKNDFILAAKTDEIYG